ncbi:hypothetical protein AB1Y20_006417 [Prymnesium parvum]|uniref:Profilin n=1 Tax=Prymnesium parvum TaxID=97485 RepID=A0AB34ICQ2_PRYPA
MEAPGRSPPLLSAAALLLSSLALLQSSRPAPASAADWPAQVSLRELSVLAANLANSSVTPPAIAPAAVTARALADGAVTPPKLADGAVTLRALDPRLLALLSQRGAAVCGDVSEDGSPARGEGYASRRVATGEYALSFSGAARAPVVLAVAQSYGVCYVIGGAPADRSVRVKCLSDLLGSSPVSANTRFSFVAFAVD